MSRVILKILKISTDLFVTAITGLRERLGFTQEQMARELGCTLRGYVSWERGERVPSGDWLLKMMRLAPDGETLAAFGLQVPDTKRDGDPYLYKYRKITGAAAGSLRG